MSTYLRPVWVDALTGAGSTALTVALAVGLPSAPESLRWVAYAGILLGLAGAAVAGARALKGLRVIRSSQRGQQRDGARA